MSIQFDDNIGPNDKTAIFDRLAEIDRRTAGQFARDVGQPMKIELNKIGEIKNVAGTTYVVTPQGWRKAEPGE